MVTEVMFSGTLPMLFKANDRVREVLMAWLPQLNSRMTAVLESPA